MKTYSYNAFSLSDRRAILCGVAAGLSFLKISRTDDWELRPILVGMSITGTGEEYYSEIIHDFPLSQLLDLKGSM